MQLIKEVNLIKSRLFLGRDTAGNPNVPYLNVLYKHIKYRTV
jgi:hypothetical protein